MPKRDGIYVALLPEKLLESGHLREYLFYGELQTLNKRTDVERDGLAVFTIGPKEWKRLSAITKRSVQTMRRWLQTLEDLGWATAERISKDTHRVTIYAYSVKKGNRHGTQDDKSTQTKSHPP